MATTVTPSPRQERTLDSIDAELADLVFRAKRVTVADEVYPVLHAEMNRLLTERQT